MRSTEQSPASAKLVSPSKTCWIAMFCCLLGMSPASSADDYASPVADSSASAAGQPKTVEFLDYQFDAGISYDDNVNRGREHREKLSDQILSFNLGKGLQLRTGSHTRLLLNGFLGYEKFDSYDGLDRAFGGAQAEFQYRPSGEFGSPIVGVFVRISRDEFRSGQRDGYRYTSGLSLRKPLTDRISLFGALSFNKRDAEEETFDASDTFLRLHADYAAIARGTLYLSGEYRRGDIVTSGPSSLLNGDLASASVEDDAFSQQDFMSYRLKARTVLATVGYNLPLGPKSSIDLSWRRARALPTESLSIAGPTPYYVDDQISVVYLLGF